jgi:uncharacterized protein (TIGR02145 family)
MKTFFFSDISILTNSLINNFQNKLGIYLFIGLSNFTIYFSFSQKITNGPNIKDIDGNIYKTIFIGDQHWMLQNLKTTKFNDGQSILQVSKFPIDDNIYTWNEARVNRAKNQTLVAWSYSENNKNTGKYYSWFVVDPDLNKEICPEGWHVPNNAEWVKLHKNIIDIRKDIERDKFLKLFFSDIRKNLNTSPYFNYYWTNESYNRSALNEIGCAVTVVWKTKENKSTGEYFNFTTDLSEDVFNEKNDGAFIRCVK